eukprot:2682062-Heterocapsa_arctica.AAC.1
MFELLEFIRHLVALIARRRQRWKIHGTELDRRLHVEVRLGHEGTHRIRLVCVRPCSMYCDGWSGLPRGLHERRGIQRVYLCAAYGEPRCSTKQRAEPPQGLHDLELVVVTARGRLHHREVVLREGGLVEEEAAVESLVHGERLVLRQHLRA